MIAEEPTRRRRRRRRRSRSRHQSAQGLASTMVVGLIIIAVVAAAFMFATRGPSTGSGAPVTDTDRYGRSRTPAGTPNNGGDGMIRQSEN